MGGIGKTGVRLTVGRKELCRGTYEPPMQWAQILHVAVQRIVLPEPIEQQCRLILLNGEHWIALMVAPRMPGTGERTVRIVLVQDIAIGLYQLAHQCVE